MLDLQTPRNPNDSFLEKRPDLIISNAPYSPPTYHSSEPGSAATIKNHDEYSSIGQQHQTFELCRSHCDDIENTPRALPSPEGSVAQKEKVSVDSQGLQFSSRILNISFQSQFNTPLTTQNAEYLSKIPESPYITSKPPRKDTSSTEYSEKYERQGDGSGSEIGTDIQTTQMKARERVVILRSRVLRTRRIIKERRSELRRLRENVRDAVDKLTRRTNEMAVRGTLREDFAPHYEKLLAAQDELGPAENAYDLLESRLDDEEQDLEQEEDYFYRHHDVTTIAAAAPQLHDPNSPRVEPDESLKSSPEVLSLESETLLEYLDKIDQAQSLADEMYNLENDYLKLVGDADFRRRHNIKISAETSDFLAEYPNMRAELGDTLRELEDDIFELREECLDKGLFEESEYVYEPQNALFDEVMDSVDEAHERSPLRVAALRLNHPKRYTDYEDKKDFVNQWLLDWIQDSSIDIMRLRDWIFFKCPESTRNSKYLNTESWSALALQYWNIDKAGRKANKFYNASRLDTIDGSPIRLHNTSTGRSGIFSDMSSLDFDLDAERKADEIALGSESDSQLTQKLELLKLS